MVPTDVSARREQIVSTAYNASEQVNKMVKVEKKGGKESAGAHCSQRACFSLPAVSMSGFMGAVPGHELDIKESVRGAHWILDIQIHKFRFMFAVGH